MVFYYWIDVLCSGIPQERFMTLDLGILCYLDYGWVCGGAHPFAYNLAGRSRTGPISFR